MALQIPQVFLPKIILVLLTIIFYMFLNEFDECFSVIFADGWLFRVCKFGYIVFLRGDSHNQFHELVTTQFITWIFFIISFVKIDSFEWNLVLFLSQNFVVRIWIIKKIPELLWLNIWVRLTLTQHLLMQF